MDWHRRFLQQASWTRELREYLLNEADIQRADRVLEVGCGTGAILIELGEQAHRGQVRRAGVHGLDIRASALTSAKRHAPTAILTQGDAHQLPYSDNCFDVTCCHFLLLWLSDPLLGIREMQRVTRPDGHVLALAEPDYTSRIDKPGSLAAPGTSADAGTEGTGRGSLHRRAHRRSLRPGRPQDRGDRPDRSAHPGAFDESEWQAEWAVLRTDLEGRLSVAELDRLAKLDLEARRAGERALLVPTFFVHAQV